METREPTVVDAAPTLAPDIEPVRLPAVREARPSHPADLREVPRQTRPQGAEIVIFQHSEQVDQLFAALAKAQGEPDYGDIEKTRRAKIESRREGARGYEYTYETLKDVLDATRPHLAKSGIAFMQFAYSGATTMTIRTMLGHGSGQWLYTDLVVRMDGADPQAIGSAISYLRRYAAKSVLGVAADDEDDDSKAAMARQPQAAPRKSEQMMAEAPVQAAPPAARPTAVQPSMAPIGRIVAIEQAGAARRIKLDTGFACSARDSELVSAAERLYRDGDVVELRTKPPSDPKYIPTLLEIVRQIREPGASA